MRKMILMTAAILLSAANLVRGSLGIVFRFGNH